MATEARRLVTEAELLALPETTDEVELIDGELMVPPSPSFWHQEVLQRVVVALRTWAAGQKRKVTVGQAPLEVKFGEGRILQPDAFVLLERLARDHSGPIESIPVLSQSQFTSVATPADYASLRETWRVRSAQ